MSPGSFLVASFGAFPSATFPFANSRRATQYGARRFIFLSSFCLAYELSLCGHEYAAQLIDPFFAIFCVPAIFYLVQHKRRNVVHNHCSGSNHVTLLRNKAEDFTVL
jgi:hypothetical protein